IEACRNYPYCQSNHPSPLPFPWWQNSEAGSATENLDGIIDHVLLWPYKGCLYSHARSFWQSPRVSFGCRPFLAYATESMSVRCNRTPPLPLQLLQQRHLRRVDLLPRLCHPEKFRAIHLRAWHELPRFRRPFHLIRIALNLPRIAIAF